ncbi:MULTISPECIES: hypothetical protein [Fischerella]|uniref:hypothetical protein n=1 Tax=Fischerella TaxID=1190 RepID=UPI0002EE1299|nr:MULTISPECIES: hypothetical protein [Fischerella]MBD2433495.1 hypothetical protein [Fischerella sp. FACHB-380]
MKRYQGVVGVTVGVAGGTPAGGVSAGGGEPAGGVVVGVCVAGSQAPISMLMPTVEARKSNFLFTTPPLTIERMSKEAI